MRIGINTLFLVPNKVGGTETYLRGLVFGLSKIDHDNEYILFTNKENHETFKITADNFSKKLCNVIAENKLFRIFYEQFILPMHIKRLKIDVLHSPGYVLPVKAKCANVVTIHDMQYFYYPQNFQRARLWYWKYFIPLSTRKANVIITVSHNSKKDIVNLLHIPEEKVIVTYEASKFSTDKFDKIEPDEDVFNKYGIKGDYILSVASLLPHKNLDRLSESFGLLTSKIKHQLVLVGMKGHALNIIREVIKGKNIKQERVILLGYVSDNELVALYRNASLFVLPSFFEGFGIPLVETMSFGCPIAASDRTSIPEVVGDAGILFNPENPEAIAEAIYSVLCDERLKDDLVKKGYERAKMFSWEKMAQETILAYSVAYELFLKIQ